MYNKNGKLICDNITKFLLIPYPLIEAKNQILRVFLYYIIKKQEGGIVLYYIILIIYYFII